MQRSEIRCPGALTQVQCWKYPKILSWLQIGNSLTQNEGKNLNQGKAKTELTKVFVTSSNPPISAAPSSLGKGPRQPCAEGVMKIRCLQGLQGLKVSLRSSIQKTFNLQWTSSESKQRKKNENVKQNKDSCTANTLPKNLWGSLNGGHWPKEIPQRGALCPLSVNSSVPLLS